MSCDEKVDCGRRRLLVTTAAIGSVGGAVVATPFIKSMLPSERAKAAGAPVEVDISKLGPGEMMTVEWRGKPVWLINRTDAQLETLKKTDSLVSDPKSEKQMQPKNCQNETRSIKPNLFVAVGICTHLGCSPTDKFKPGPESGLGADWEGGFICPCHGSTFDIAGRVYKSKPAPDNLEVPPHMYVSDTKLIIGEEKKGA
jgi:ubiquinol-cytochrome c reductase iron-sulfur subunit